MARTITLYGADVDTIYSNYVTINGNYILSLGGVQYVEVKVLDVESTSEMSGENIEYINGELGNNNQLRRNFEITCEPFTYSSNSFGAMTIQDLRMLQLLMQKKYLWVTFSDYEFLSHAALYSSVSVSEEDWYVLPVVLTDSQSGKDNSKGIRTFSFTLKHRWNNDLKLNSIE